MSATDPAPLPEPRSRTRTVVVASLALVVTFAAGLLVGVVGDRLFMLHHMGPRALPALAVHAMIGRLDHHLDLTREQRAEIERILARRHDKMLALMDQVRPQIRAQVDETNAEIERVLTPEQRVKFQDVKIRLGPMMHRRH